jgi:uncharacterized protein (DUF362 family)
MNDYRAYVGKTTDNLALDVVRAMEAVGWTDRVKASSTVFVKPNLTFYEYRPGVTTTPAVLRELLRLLKTRASRVIVGESDGGNHSFTADQAFEGHGLPSMCKELGVELVNLSSLPAVDVEESIQGVRVKVQLPKLLLDDIDCFVSAPVLKVHAMTHVTLSMKNLWGCYPDTMRGLHHSNLAYKLTLITKKLNPQVVLIDGTYTLDNHGPMYGTPKKTDLLLAANNPVVSDAFGTAIMSMDLRKVEHILVAEREGLGTTDLSKVQIPVDWIDYKIQCRVQRTFIDNLSTLLFKSDFIAKLVMDSPLKPAIYGVAGKFRNKDEQKVVAEIEKHKNDSSR